jgi:hypothetical protein
MRQHNLHAPQLFATHDVPAPVYAVHLEQALGQIKADCRNHEEGANWIFKSAKGMTHAHPGSTGSHPAGSCCRSPVNRLSIDNRVPSVAAASRGQGVPS